MCQGYELPIEVRSFNAQAAPHQGPFLVTVAITGTKWEGTGSKYHLAMAQGCARFQHWYYIDAHVPQRYNV